MRDFLKTNKTTNIYWLKQPLQDLNITLKLKTQESITLLPKLKENLNKSKKKGVQNGIQFQEFTFQWQEKVFNQYQFTQLYDIQNCVSERDLAYNRSIDIFHKTPQKVFTYINEDYALPYPIFKPKGHDKGCLIPFFDRLSLDFENHLRLGISMHHLFKSEDDVPGEDEWRAMHIFYDNSKYDEDSNLIFQDDCHLVSVYHNTKYNYMVISPDINNESNPYAVECSSGYLNVDYYINVNFVKTGCGKELKGLLNAVLHNLEKRQKNLTRFVMPALGKRKYYISFEIKSSKGFDFGNLYIEYHIKIPENTDCDSKLNGRTHLTKSLVNEDLQVWNYGHIMDFEVEVASGIDTLPIKIFFEAISVDMCGRHRTEGYTSLYLSLTPGYCKKQLSCSRPEELNEIDAECRRFFVGGCHLIEDLEVLNKPQLYETNIKFVSTGSIAVHWTVISQYQASVCDTIGNYSPVPHSSSSELIQGADAVLMQYKRAKATLAAATRTLQTVDSE